MVNFFVENFIPFLSYWCFSKALQ